MRIHSFLIIQQFRIIGFAQRLTESSTALPRRGKIGVAKTVPKKMNAIVTVERRIRDKWVNVRRQKDVEDQPEDSPTAPARAFIHPRWTLFT